MYSLIAYLDSKDNPALVLQVVTQTDLHMSNYFDLLANTSTLFKPWEVLSNKLLHSYFSYLPKPLIVNQIQRSIVLQMLPEHNRSTI